MKKKMKKNERKCKKMQKKKKCNKISPLPTILFTSNISFKLIANIHMCACVCVYIYIFFSFVFPVYNTPAINNGVELIIVTFLLSVLNPKS